MGSQTGGADHVNNFENVAWNKESPVYLLQNEPAPLHVCGEGGGRKEKTPAVNEEVRMEGFGEDEPEPWWRGGGRENGCESSECRLARRGCLPQSEKWDQSGKTQQIMSKRGSSHFKIHRHVRTLGVDRHGRSTVLLCDVKSVITRCKTPASIGRAVCAFADIHHEKQVCSSWVNRPPTGVRCYLLNDVFLL